MARPQLVSPCKGCRGYALGGDDEQEGAQHHRKRGDDALVLAPMLHRSEMTRSERDHEARRSQFPTHQHPPSCPVFWFSDPWGSRSSSKLLAQDGAGTFPKSHRNNATTSDNSKYRDSLVLCISVHVLAIRSIPWPQPASHLAPTARFLKLFHFNGKVVANLSETCRNRPKRRKPEHLRRMRKRKPVPRSDLDFGSPTDPATSVELPRMLLLAIVLVGPRT